MPYINIKEYDYTITAPKQQKYNIVAVPINASDGPSDKWVTIHNYDDFVQTFGTNPNTTATFGSSWEYAANLLLRGMSVCVRRITNVLTEEGDNAELLEGVDTAKAVIKVKDVIGNDIGTGSLAEGLITVTDNAKHSVLKNSSKGEEIDNPLYKYYTYEEDGDTKRSEYANVHVLQTDETNRIVGAFADVITTESEWNFVGEHDNPHYKYQKLGDSTPMSYIKKMNQTLDANNKPYVIGDFFINEANHVVKYSPTPILNPNWIRGQKQYPDDLKDIKLDSITLEHFVDVTYDATNKKAVNLVWLYSDTETTVSNHKFVNGTIDVKDAPYKVFETNADLPMTNVGVNYFAPVKSTNTIWEFNGETWGNTGAALNMLTAADSQYSIEVTIPFICSNKAINTDIYKHYFNWENTGEEVYIDIDHPELAYVPKLYWENSNNEIGTRPHKVLSGAEIVINDIVINTSADTSKSAVSLQVNGHQDIKVDTDYTNTRLISGNYGITNMSDEPVKIYGLRITQKADNGEISVVYDAGIEKVINSSGRITSDPLFKIYNISTGDYLADPIPKLDNTTTEDKWYIELDPGCSIYYNRNLTNGIFNLKVAGFNNFEIVCHTFTTASGSYDIALTALKNTVAEVIKRYVPVTIDEKIDYNNIPIHDGNQNFNMFVVEYRHPGTNGNLLNVYVRTIPNRGIYLYVNRNKQHLETIELCSFRFRNGNTGRVNTLDMDLNKDAIWKTILSKFGVLILDDGKVYDGNLNPIVDESAIGSIYGNYVKVSINPEIIKNENVTSLDYLLSLYAQTGSVITQLKGGSIPSEEHVLHEVSKCYVPLEDKYRFDITYVSNGGYVDKITYPKAIVNVLANDSDVRLIEDAMLDLATSRKDCVALLDVPYDLPLEDVPYYFEHMSTSYAAAYDPWAYMLLSTGMTKWMPPSFVHLYTHAKSIQAGNKLYLPPAGVRRAQVPEIFKTNHDLTSKYISAWQDNSTPQYVNPIIWISGYDFTIYGQKTLYNRVNGSDDYQSALQDLNVRLVANEIKKLIFKTCIDLTFELNNMMTWNEFKSKIEPTLSVMLGEGVLTKYDILMGTETMTVADLNSGHVVGTVRVSVARAATDWDINFELTPNGVSFTEVDYNSQYSE